MWQWVVHQNRFSRAFQKLKLNAKWETGRLWKIVKDGHEYHMQSETLVTHEKIHIEFKMEKRRLQTIVKMVLIITCKARYLWLIVRMIMSKEWKERICERLRSAWWVVGQGCSANSLRMRDARGTSVLRRSKRLKSQLIWLDILWMLAHWCTQARCFVANTDEWMVQGMYYVLLTPIAPVMLLLRLMARCCCMRWKEMRREWMFRMLECAHMDCS